MVSDLASSLIGLSWIQGCLRLPDNPCSPGEISRLYNDGYWMLNNQWCWGDLTSLSIFIKTLLELELEVRYVSLAGLSYLHSCLAARVYSK